MSKGGDDAYNAQMIYAQLKDQASFLDEKIGSELSHPAQFLYYLKSKKADSEFISKIRWLPSLDLKHYSSLAPSLVEEYDMLIESDKKQKIKAARAAS
jgi:hypothetical protein